MLPHYLVKLEMAVFFDNWAEFKQSVIDKAIDQCMAAKAEGMCSCQWTPL